MEAEKKYCATVPQGTGPLAMNGMVTSPHHLATQAGLAILRKGGNAVDAAIATAAVLAVVYPHMCTPGGDSFWLICNGRTGELKALNASGRAGKKATITFYRERGITKIPAHGWLAANTVPGAVSGWDEAHRFSRDVLGSKISWAELLDDAIAYAQEGCPVAPSLVRWTAIDTDPDDLENRCLQRFPEFSRIFLKNGGPLTTGDILRQPDLARSLSLIAEHGAREFYEGSIARAIAEDMERRGGLLSLDDFEKHRADWQAPISVNYRGLTAYNCPPNSQGMASLEILNILNHFDVNAMGEGTADYYHLLVEATKEAFLDRDAYLTDPDFADIPLSRLLSAEHGRAQAARIDMARAAGPHARLEPKGDTVWLGTADKDGNCVSLIQSIFHDFGSAVIPGGTGILLQNRGSYFSLDPKHVNCLMPGKRTFHTLTPAMLFRQGRPWLIYGSMGGEGQPQTQAALVTRIVDFGMTPQEAIAAPRWIYGRSWGAESNDVKIEGRVPAEVIDKLSARGHRMTVIGDYVDVMGHAGAILLHDSGVMQGGTDPRSDGQAAGC